MRSLDIDVIAIGLPQLKPGSSLYRIPNDKPYFTGAKSANIKAIQTVRIWRKKYPDRFFGGPTGASLRWQPTFSQAMFALHTWRALFTYHTGTLGETMAARCELQVEGIPLTKISGVGVYPREIRAGVWKGAGAADRLWVSWSFVQTCRKLGGKSLVWGPAWELLTPPLN